MRTKITQAMVNNAPVPEKGTALYTDTELPGFYVIVGKTKRSYYVQSLVNGKQVRTKLGSHPVLSAREAREKARKTLQQMRDGIDPVAERRRARDRGITLREALELHLSSKRHSEATVQGYRYMLSQYSPDWLDRPLSDLGDDRAGARARHMKISAVHGKTTGDYWARVLRAVYSRGLRQCPELPVNPVGNVDMNGARPRVVKVKPEELLDWGRAVLELESPVRRDLHLFMLLSGMRRTAATTARVVDLGDSVLRVPCPKGGSDRAFELPLSKALQALLASRAEEARRMNSQWLFFANSSTGHIQEIRDKALGRLIGHALRHVFASLASEAGVDWLALRALLNHATGGNVTLGYVRLSHDHLLIQQERASAYILARLGLRFDGSRWPPDRR